MRWDDRSFGPSPADTRRRGTIDAPFICACLAMFDAGLDTAAIAGRMIEPEHAVAQAVRLGREARRPA